MLNNVLDSEKWQTPKLNLALSDFKALVPYATHFYLVTKNE